MAYKDLSDPRNKAAKLRHYYNNKEQYLARNKVIKAEKIAYIRKLREDNPCMDCGKKYPYYVMDFDHRDPSAKLTEVSRLVNFGWVKLKAEIEKCDIVCSNCHRERTHGD
jgi:hypothetical protein